MSYAIPPDDAGPSSDPTDDPRMDGVVIPPLARFDPIKQVPDSFFIILEGRRRVGKSVWARWFLQFHRKRFKWVIVLTETKMNKFWQQIVDEPFVHGRGWDPGLVEHLLQVREMQLSSDKYKPKEGVEDPPWVKKLYTLLILDDVIGGEYIHDDQVLIRLAVQARHFKISVLLTTQDPHAIHPKLRNNTDLAVIFNQKTDRSMESVWKDFMNILPKDFAFTMMKRLLNEKGNNIVSVVTEEDTSYAKNFFNGKGELDVEPYKLGGAEQHAVAKKVMDARKKKREEAAANARKHNLTAMDQIALVQHKIQQWTSSPAIYSAALATDLQRISSQISSV